MASDRPLPSDVVFSGVDQPSLVTMLLNIMDLINEIQTDQGTLRTELVAIGTSLANYKTIYDAHTHLSDGNAATVSLPDTSSPTGSPGAASAFTDTSGSSVPAALTNSTAITNLRS